MTLPQGALALRRRSGWEAADSGLLLWRSNWPWFLLFFALPLGGIALGLRLILPAPMRPWAYLIIWWLKPLFDRSILHVTGLRFFESQAGAARLFRGLGKSLIRGLAGDLLRRRFSPWRASHMPVQVLENLRGRRLRDRRKALIPGGLNFCALLTILGLALEAVLLIGEMVFSLIMAELFRPDLFPSMIGSFMDLEPLIFVACCFNLVLVESLYVCMGFGLYINSRVEAEGWDIQLLFRNFTEAKKGKKPGRGGALVLILWMMALLPLRGYAETAAPQDAQDTTEGAFETLREILQSPDFGGEKEGWGIRFKEKKDPPDFPQLTPAPWLEKIKLAFAYTLRTLVILSIAALGVFSLHRLYSLGRERGWAPMKGRNPGENRSGQTPAGIPPARKNPASLLDLARDLHSQGRIREAWAACFAGAAAAYTRYRGLCFPPDATEYECLALVRSSGSTGAGGFAELVLCRIDLAYRGLSPEAGAFERALDFCRSLDGPESAPGGEKDHG
ncbi:MAG: hypothetical protein LBP93_02430 [Treponema sp.]|jgi:hypothetical protein|nr:hypothetical protein [Treponema sp.]